MKYFAYIAVLVCAILTLAAAEPLNRVQRSPAPIAAPEPDPHGYYGYRGYGIGYGRGYGQSYGYNQGYGYGYGQRYGYGRGRYYGGF